MSFDRSSARCSFCGRHSSEVQRMIAGPGAAYICNDCLELCTDILHDSTPFSTKALELASRPPVVIAAPRFSDLSPTPKNSSSSVLHTVNLEIEQKQQGMTLILHQLLYFQNHFELLYLWIRPAFASGFSFVPRTIFFLKDNLGTQWLGDKGGTLLARPELASGPTHTVYQGNARFRPLPPSGARTLTVRVADPLGQFENSPPHPWEFEITLNP